MKTRIYLIFLLFAGITNAQNIPFDGTAFKTQLVSASTSNGIAKDVNGASMKIDTSGDGEISVAEASLVYQLYVGNLGLPNISGIEYFTNLRTVDFSQNAISTVTLSSLTNLEHVIANHNNLTTIDVSALTHLVDLDVSNNSLLTIYAKNGTTSDTLTFDGGNNNGLSYICIDEAQVASLINQMGGGYNCVVNSNCTPTPGGSYNTISGKIVYDATANGIDASDPTFPFVKVQAVVGSQTIQTTTNQNGEYNFYISQPSGTSYSVTPIIENNSVFSPTTALVGTLGTTVANNFPLTTAAVPTPDLEIVVAPISGALTGMNAVYQVTYKNKGSKKVTGTALLLYDSALASIVSCSEVGAAVGTAGQVSVDFSNLLPFETRSFLVTLALNSSATTGSSLVFSSYVTDSMGATEPATVADNTFSYRQTVGPVNANAVSCLEGQNASASQIGDYLHYRINFQNSGSAVAVNVVVKMTFNAAKYDVNSLQLLNASNPVDFQLEGAKALFFMRNANIGGPGGGGGILLKIKSNSALPAGSTVGAGAELFFDYGANISAATVSNSTATTNTAATTFQNLSVAQNEVDPTIAIAPNPTSSTIVVTGSSNIKTVQLYDLFGRLLQTNLTDAPSVSIDLTQRSEGIYFLKVGSEKGQQVQKIIKE